MDQVNKDLAELKALLGQELDTTSGFTLAAQLTAVEAWGARVAYMHRSAEAKLSQKRLDVKPMKDKMFPNDLDRTTYMNAMSAGYQQEADYLGDLAERVDKRISLGQTLLKNVITELKSGLRIE